MVAMRPIDSWRTESRSAEVGEAVESPTPTPGWCQCIVLLADDVKVGYLSNVVSEMGVQMRCAETGEGAGMVRLRDEADATYLLYAMRDLGAGYVRDLIYRMETQMRVQRRDGNGTLEHGARGEHACYG
jgi:hypothetical protein